MMKMDWEESPPPPPSRVDFDKTFSTSQQQHSSVQFHNNFQQQSNRHITSSSSATSLNNYLQSNNSGSNNGSISSCYRNNHQAINLSESGSKSGLNNHIFHHFSSSSANTSPSGSSTSSSPPLLSTSFESNGSSLNPPATTSTPSPSLGSASITGSLSPSSCKSNTNNSPSNVSQTTASTNATRSNKKHKPIPPPLDLSIGAANLSLHSNDPDSSSPTPINLNSANPINGSCLTPNFFERPCYYLASPKFNQAEKSLPLRKRWHSWSPLLMNSQTDPMLPLFAETGGNGGPVNPGTTDKDQTPTNTHSNMSFSINPMPSSKVNQSGGPATSSSSQSSYPGGIRSNSKFKNNELQTPTPFYTPNEQSPKFMNSPVFSYSTPDTSLYQGPFSPIRSAALFPPLLPGSPFLNSPNLNTPTFVIPNTNGAHSNNHCNSSSNSCSASNTLTVPSFNNLPTNSLPSSSSYSLSSTSTSSSMSTTYSTLVPSTMLSPASSQASSSNSVSYEDLHEKSSSLTSLNNSSIQLIPIWNIFFPGTRIRFLQDSLNSIMDWHLVDILDMKDDYAPSGLEVRTLVVTCSAKERIHMTLCPVADPSHPAVEVSCDPGHPFMVEKKGWCAVNPDVCFEAHGVRCQKLQCGDICVKYTSLNTRKSPLQQQPQHINVQTSMHDGLAYNNFVARNGIKMPTSPPSIDMKPVLDQHMNCMPPPEMKSVSPVTHIPISVVKQKPQSTPNPLPRKKSVTASNSIKKSKSKDMATNEQRGRRPMNAFLLFAKDKRPELIQLYPGKDNRSISVLLGEAWQSLGPADKEQYASNARAKAEEQKRIHPDCWKRKKAQSSSSSSSATGTNNPSSGNNNLSLSNSNKHNLGGYSPLSIPIFQHQLD